MSLLALRTPRINRYNPMHRLSLKLSLICSAYANFYQFEKYLSDLSCLVCHLISLDFEVLESSYFFKKGGSRHRYCCMLRYLLP